MRLRRVLAEDDIEDAKSRGFRKAQQFSTSCPHLIEIEYVENRAFQAEAGNRLWRRISVFKYLQVGHLLK
jgi:hypothetical protein